MTWFRFFFLNTKNWFYIINYWGNVQTHFVMLQPEEVKIFPHRSSFKSCLEDRAKVEPLKMSLTITLLKHLYQ